MSLVARIANTLTTLKRRVRRTVESGAADTLIGRVEAVAKEAIALAVSILIRVLPASWIANVV